jgi:1-acyl-sn-glycerol-3-phosphate acyltransferase
MIAGAAAEFDARDPEFIRSQLPIMWLLATLYFRAEVRGLERVPEHRPVLFVGNHSGGNMTPDSLVFVLGFNTYFGVERPLYALAHSLVTAWPVVGARGRKWGIITAGHEAATAALEAGACVLVYRGATSRPIVRGRLATRSGSPAGRDSSGWPARRASRSSPWCPRAASRRSSR